MKRIFFAAVLMLISGILLLANGQSRSSNLTISKYGVLLTVPDANDKESITLDQAGFRVSYTLDGNKQTPVWASAADSGGLRPGQIRVDGNSASVTVTTDDGALVITSEFTFDVKRNQLIIRRTLKNNSAKKLVLQLTENLDEKMMGTSGSASLESRALVRLKGSGCNDDPKAERPPSHPCIILVCPEVHWASLRTSGRQVSLNWNCPKTVARGGEVRFEVQVELR